jgi:excisionase family DNA binding protein
MEDRWLSVGEICEYLGVTRETIYAWLSQKGLPGHRVGRLWKFKRAEIDEWVRTGGTTDRSVSENGNVEKKKA